MRASEPGRAGADHSDAFAARRRTVVRMGVFRHKLVGRVALKAADLDRLPLGDFAHAGLLAERLRRANARAHATENVLIEDRFRGALRLAGGDLPNKERYVDRRRTSRHAGGVVAKVATI